MRGCTRRWWLYLWLIALAPSPVTAQPITTAFSYQGSLDFQGQPANGSFDLQFTPYANASTTQPLLPALILQDVPVQNGLFHTSVDFGGALFLGDAVFLQIGVRPGASSGAFQTLLPRTAVHAAPYALKVRAGSVTDLELAPGSVGSNALADGAVSMAKIADGAVGFEQISTGSVSSSQIANGGVAAVDLANGAVTAAAIQDGQVLTAKLADGAVSSSKLADGAVGSAKLAPAAAVTDRIADLAVTRAKIATAAVGLAQIDTSAVQARLNGYCERGHALLGVQSDGTPLCDSVDRVADYAGDVGSYPSIAYDIDSRPLLSYFDATNTALKLYDCHDIACTGGESRVLDNSADVGRYTKMMRRNDNRMLIAYSDAAAGLKLYLCADARCTGGVARTLDPTPSSGRWPSIGIRSDGRPIIAHYAATGGDLRLYDCNDVDCTTGTARLLESGGDVGNYPSLLVQGANLILISYHDASNGDLRLYTCSNAACSAGSSRLLDNSAGTIGRYTNIVRISGSNPTVLYQDATQGQIKSYGCSTFDCSAGNILTLTAPPDVVAGGNLRATANYFGPTLLYLDPNAEQVRLVNCARPDCSGDVGAHQVVASNIAADISVLALVVGNSALSHLAIYDRTDEHLRVLRCGTYSCQ